MRELAPVAPSERIEVLDALRAFALFGILLVNFPGAMGGPLAAWNPRVAEAQRLLVSGSFYPLFSFLFGLGLGIQLVRAADRRRGVALLYARRLLALFLIGTLHSVLLWNGDILANYALIGVVLLLMHRLPPRAILVSAMLLLVAGMLFAGRLRDALADWGPTATWIAERNEGFSLGPALEAEHTRAAWGERLAQGGGWLARVESTTKQRAFEYVSGLREQLNPMRFLEGGGNTILFAFLVGLYAGQRRLLEDLTRRGRGMVGAMLAGLALTSFGNAYSWLGLSWGPEVSWIAGTANNWGLTLFYVAAVCALFVRGGAAARALRFMAPAGRMGLTNYLMQSVFMMWFFFESYGASLPNPGRTLMVGVHVAFFFGVQVPLSHWWLARYRFGPAEWVWRSLTYGGAQPMRRVAEEQRASPSPAAAPA